MENLKEKIESGKVFVYPTDTVYGLGCDATNEKSVNRIKKIKGRDASKPMSVIAPSVEWIQEHCLIDDRLDLSKYLPGPYTLILKKKNVDFLKSVASGDTLGVRIPKSEFCDEIRKVGVPFVTTSVNLSGEPPAVEVSEIDNKIIEKVDEVVDYGKLNGKPSTLVIGGKEMKR